MAKYNEILVGRFNRALQKLLAMKGGPPAPQLASEIQASLSSILGVDYRYLEGWSRFGVADNIAAVAAQNDAALLRNPTGSNVIAVVERAYINVFAADTVFADIVGIGDFASVIGPTALDSRHAGNSVLHASKGNNSTGTIHIHRVQILANVVEDVVWLHNQEIPLLPGSGLVLYNTTVNTSMNWGFRWRERFLEDSERT